VKDGSSVDSTTVTGREALREECPGTGDDAAIKVHPVLSVGGGAPVRDHVSPAREPDRRPLTIDEAWRGGGLLADRGYASRERLRACDAPDGRVVIRLNDHGTPHVDDSARGQVPQEGFPGPALDPLLEEEILVLHSRASEADGYVGGDKRPRPLRLVGVHTPKGDGCFLTNLPPRLGPQQVADLYRVRWEVERRLRLDNSGNRLDAIAAERPCALKTLLHAALMASTLAALLAPPHNLQTCPMQAGKPHLEAPLPPRRLALQLAVSCQAMAQAFDLKGVEAPRRWDTIAALLTHSGQDPNWHRRPSVLEQLRGWKRQPMARKGTDGGDANHGHLKTAA
jgi:hypothetical protein